MCIKSGSCDGVANGRAHAAGCEGKGARRGEGLFPCKGVGCLSKGTMVEDG